MKYSDRHSFYSAFFFSSLTPQTLSSSPFFPFVSPFSLPFSPFSQGEGLSLFSSFLFLTSSACCSLFFFWSSISASCLALTSSAILAFSSAFFVISSAVFGVRFELESRLQSRSQSRKRDGTRKASLNLSLLPLHSRFLSLAQRNMGKKSSSSPSGLL